MPIPVSLHPAPHLPFPLPLPLPLPLPSQQFCGILFAIGFFYWQTSSNFTLRPHKSCKIEAQPIDNSPPHYLAFPFPTLLLPFPLVSRFSYGFSVALLQLLQTAAKTVQLLFVCQVKIEFCWECWNCCKINRNSCAIEQGERRKQGEGEG